MIVYSNIIRTDSLDFDVYIKKTGFSFSFLKNEQHGFPQEVNQTKKILIGKIVDAILTEYGSVDMACEEYPIARSIAKSIKERFGAYITRFQKQVSYSGIMTFRGHHMLTRGRLDYLLPQSAVIDLKVTHEKDYKAVIKFMNYDDQLWNYCGLANVRRKYIMIHSVPLNKTEMIDMGIMTLRNAFWESKILKFGDHVA